MSLKKADNLVAEEKEMTLKEIILTIEDFVSYLLSKWKIILISGFLGGLIGLTYSYVKDPIYTSITTFVLEDEKSASGGGLSSLAGLASIAGVNIGGSGGGIFQGDNLLELYKSRKMIEKTLLTASNSSTDQLLVDKYIEFNKLKEKWANKPELLKIKFSPFGTSKLTRLQDSIIGSIVLDINKNNLIVNKPDKKLSIIRVDVKSKNENFSKDFNDRIVENVNDFYKQTKTKKSLDNLSILQLKTDSVRSVMNGAIFSAAIASDETPNLNPTRQVQRIAPLQKAQFSAETNKAVLSELIKNLEMSKMSLLRETPLIQVVDQPVYPLQMDRLGKFKGILFGGVLFGFLTVLYLILKRVYKEVLINE